jgi:hypothetical protein
MFGVVVVDFVVVVRSRRDERLAERDFRLSRDSPQQPDPLLWSYLVKLGSIDSS